LQDTTHHRPQAGGRGLLAALLLTLSLRLLFVFVPPFADSLPRGYTRAAEYVEVAQNLLDGKGIVRSKERMDRVLADWRVRGTRLPREIQGYPLGAQPEYQPFRSEVGYLFLTAFLGKVTGQVRYANMLVVQCLMSTLCCALLYRIAPAYTRRPQAPLLAALCYGLNPLELFLSTYPDLIIWAVYAGVVGVYFVGRVWNTQVARDLLAVAGIGFFLGLCVVIRATTVALFVVWLCPFILRRPGTLALALTLGLGGLLPFELSYIIAKSQPGEAGAAGAASYHNLLGGLGEFGDVPGLRYDDRVILKWVNDQGYRDPHTHQPFPHSSGRYYDSSCERAYWKLFTEDPWRPFLVAAKRLAHFTVAYRPEKESPPLLAVITLLKLLFLAGVVAWWRECADPFCRRQAVCFLGIASAPVLVHLPLSPLLEVYIAPSVILGGLIAAYGAGVVVGWLRTAGRSSRD